MEDPVEELLEEAALERELRDEDEYEHENEEEGMSDLLWGIPSVSASQVMPPLRQVFSDSQLGTPQPHVRLPKVLSYTEETRLRVQKRVQQDGQSQRVKEEQKRRARVQKARLDEFRRAQRIRAVDTKEKEEKQIKEASKVVAADPALVSALRAKHTLVSTEQHRVRNVREVIKATITIQRAWRRYCARRRAAAAAAAAASNPPKQPRGSRLSMGAAPSRTTAAPVARARPGPPAPAPAPAPAAAPAPTPVPPPAATSVASSKGSSGGTDTRAHTKSPTRGVAKNMSKLTVLSPSRPSNITLTSDPLPPSPTQESPSPPADHVHGAGCNHKGCQGNYPTYRPFKARAAPASTAPAAMPAPVPDPARPVPALAQALGYK